MLARATRPKLSLTVPSVSVAPSLSLAIPSSTTPSASVAPMGPRSPLTFLPAKAFSAATSSALSSAAVSASPRSATFTPTTTRNTLFNSRGLATLQVPSQQSRTITRVRKSVKFSEEQSVRYINPMPQDYYGDYVKMSREERRWGSK